MSDSNIANPHASERICTRVDSRGVIVPKIPVTYSQALYNCATWNGLEARKHAKAPHGTYGHRTYLRLIAQQNNLIEQAANAEWEENCDL